MVDRTQPTAETTTVNPDVGWVIAVAERHESQLTGAGDAISSSPPKPLDPPRRADTFERIRRALTLVLWGAAVVLIPAAAASAQTTSHRQRLPLIGCLRPGSDDFVPTYKPARHCLVVTQRADPTVDDQYYLTDIHWSHWGKPTATATAKLSAPAILPTSVPATLRASRKLGFPLATGSCHYETAYTQLDVAWLSAHSGSRIFDVTPTFQC